MKLPKLKDYIEAEKENKVISHHITVNNIKMIGFKYTLQTIYNYNWDEITLNARGIVFNEETGEILARPFKKFFNYKELIINEQPTSLYNKLPVEFKPNLNGHFRVMEKVDGSLGILFYTGNKWLIKTGGEFNSEQAIWANNWCIDNIDTTLLNKTKTYCFEIIYDGDIHPITYDYEGLVLLSVIDNKTGEEESLNYIKETAKKLNVRIVELYDFDDFYKVEKWSKCLPKTKEGVVVTFDNGYKCKLKGDEWCELARKFEGITEWKLWKVLDLEGLYFHAHVDETKDYIPLDNIPLLIPEELPKMYSYGQQLITTLKELSGQVSILADKAQHITTRKEQFEYVKKHAGNLLYAVMNELDVRLGKSKPIYVLKAIHKTLNPNINTDLTKTKK